MSKRTLTTAEREERVARRATLREAAAAKIESLRALPQFNCSCGRSFESLRGLRTHQGHVRRGGWDQPGASRWSAHLTKVGSR